MPTTLPQLESQLARGELRPIYLIAGAEDLLRIEAADAVRAAARKQGFAEREVFDVEKDFDWDSVTAGFMAMSLFSTRRVIELRLPTGKPGVAGAAVIEAFCAQPAQDICLLITAHEWSRAHETGWVKQVDRAGVFLAVWPLKPNELPAWISRRLKAKGVRAESDAAVVLAQRVEGNLLVAAQEIDKLVLLAAGETLTAERMESLVADSARFDVFGLVEAALAGDAARAIRMLRSLRAEGESIVLLLGWVAGQVQVLARLSAALDRGENLAQALSAAKVWELRQPLFRKALNRLRRGDVEAALRRCAEIERISKGRAAGDDWLELERLLLGLARPQVLAA